MKKLIETIRDEWVKPVREAQLKTKEHAPLEIHDKPSLIHVDGSSRNFKLLQEENFEYKEAAANGDLVGIADALGDQIYVLCGTIAQHGMTHIIEDVLMEIHRSNKSKQIEGEMSFNHIGKLNKPEGYSKPDLGKILF